MTLLQLKYICYIAQCGTLSKAAQLAYVSQPSLSVALKELETEIGTELFVRSNRGLQLTPEGTEFLTYASHVLEQFALMEEKYLLKTENKQKFAISTQHYSFVVQAFIHLAQKFNMDDYEFALRETKTLEILDDVSTLRSELGILYLNDFNRAILQKSLKQQELSFVKLLTCYIYVYLWIGHPLAREKKITLEMLQDYPCLSFEQGTQKTQGGFFYAEEVLSTYQYKQSIKVNDRATMLNFMKGLQGYTLCSGILSQNLNGDDYLAVPLDSMETMEIGYIKKNQVPLSPLAYLFLEEIEKLYLSSPPHS